MDWEASSDLGQVQNICNNFLRHKKGSNDQALLLMLRYWVCWLSSVCVCDVPNSVMRCACCGDDGCVYWCYIKACAVK